MKVNEFLDELRASEHMGEADVRKLAGKDPEELWRKFLAVQGTLEPDPEVIGMKEDMERDIARMRENMRSMASYYAMMDFPEPDATVRTILRALDERDTDMDAIYGEEREEDDGEDGE